MANEKHTLNLSKDQFELLDIILFEEWRDHIDYDPSEDYEPRKYYSDKDLEIYNSLIEVVKLEKLRKGLDSNWSN